MEQGKEVKKAMCVPFQMHPCDCMGPCGCSEILTLDEEIRKAEILRQHLKLRLDLIERRLDSLKK